VAIRETNNKDVSVDVWYLHLRVHTGRQNLRWPYQVHER